MAVKKAAVKKAEVKVEAKAPEVKVLVKPLVEVKTPVEVKKPVVEAKKEPVKKVIMPKKTAAKKVVAKKEPVKKESIKESMYIEFSEKSYTQEDLVKITKDIWKYDLKKKAGDFNAVELYVKTEENRAYYVINGTEQGSFEI